MSTELSPEKKTPSDIFRSSSPNKPMGHLSPVKSTGQSTSSKFIEQLHLEIDELKSENLKVKNSNEELKKSNELLKKRRDQLVEQLSNVKHENDTVNSLLKRKERRINDLEEQLENMESDFKDQSFKIKNFENVKRELDHNVAELSRLQISYDTIVTGQKEYREHYKNEIQELKQKLNSFIDERTQHINKNITLINKSDTTIYRSLKSITLRSKELDEKYTKKNDHVVKALERLTRFSNKHNLDLKSLIELSKDLFEEIADKFGLDKTELLESYLKESPSGNTSPFEIAERTLSNEPKQEISVEQSSDVSQGSSIQVLKREERKATKSSFTKERETIEQRIHSLGKDLNGSIPSKDRVPLPNKKNHYSHSRKSSHNSRRSSALYEEKVKPQFLQDTGGADTRSTSLSSRMSSNSEPRKAVFDMEGQNILNDSYNSSSTSRKSSGGGGMPIISLSEFNKVKTSSAGEPLFSKYMTEDAAKAQCLATNTDEGTVVDDSTNSAVKHKRRRKRRGRKNKPRDSSRTEEENQESMSEGEGEEVP